jgi:hypothetical protein
MLCACQYGLIAAGATSTGGFFRSNNRDRRFESIPQAVLRSWFRTVYPGTTDATAVSARAAGGMSTEAP